MVLIGDQGGADALAEDSGDNLGAGKKQPVKKESNMVKELHN